MPVGRIERHGTPITWSASGSINLDLSNKPFTITELWVVVRPSITTTTQTIFNDFWDRIINTLSLSGAGKSYFNFTNLRAAYWLSQMMGVGTPRPAPIADSQTTLVKHFAYCFHFGVQPYRLNRAGNLVRNPFDLTAGIPPVGPGNLTLQGTFGTATAGGTNMTVASGTVDVYLVGVQQDGGEPRSAYYPQAIPIWSMETPTPTATSGVFTTRYNIPSGDYLHSMLVMLTNGTNAPRDDAVLTSLSVFSQKENREILAFGGQTGVALDAKFAEIFSQIGYGSPFAGRFPGDNVSTAVTGILTGGTAGTPTIAEGVNSGLIWLPLADLADVRGGGDPKYGVDMRELTTGDLQLRYGVADATGVTEDVVMRKYQPL